MPDLSHALHDLSDSHRSLVESQLRLVDQGQMSPELFWKFWSVITGRPVPADPPDADLPWPGGIDPATLPTWIANSWTALRAERNPRLQLLCLIDTAELVVRWAVALAIAEIVHANAGTLPEDVAAIVRRVIQRPTLGIWLSILKTLADHAPEAPVATDGLFEWARMDVQRRFGRDAEGETPERSLLVLRNLIAHGGHFTQRRASDLLDAQLPALVSLVEGLRNCLGTTVVHANGRVMMGPDPVDAGHEAEGEAESTSVWLARGDVRLPLDPLALYGPVRQLRTDGKLHDVPGGPAPQLYRRTSEDGSSNIYTTLAGDSLYTHVVDVARFRDLFRIDHKSDASRNDGTNQPLDRSSFLEEAKLSAQNLIGRRDEVKKAKEWLRMTRSETSEDNRIGMIIGGPGIGKSMLMAKLAGDFGQNDDDRRAVFLHCFRGGHPGNSRRVFLQLLRDALLHWSPLRRDNHSCTTPTPEGKALEDEVVALLESVARIPRRNDRARAPAFWVFVDGLDEVVSADPDLPNLIGSLAKPHTLWLVASRPDDGIRQSLLGHGAQEVFAGGLPPMNDEDIRAMLTSGLDEGRRALIQRDVELENGEVVNPFIAAVSKRAHGLPLYVHLLLRDLHLGHYSVHDDDKLPDGLTAYYDELLTRMGFSTVNGDLTGILALLSQAREPLDPVGLALLLSGDPKLVDEYIPRVEEALRAGSTLLRRAPSPETTDARTLCHESFREHIDRAQKMAGSVRDARRRLVHAAANWSAHSATSLAPVRSHLFRWGTDYAQSSGNHDDVAAARARLIDFAYLQARTATLPAHECIDLAHEFETLVGPAAAADSDLSIWTQFVQERTHLLCRGDDAWPANRILTQLAVEHADDSPVTRAAEAWLATGPHDLLWLRKAERVRRTAYSGCRRVLAHSTSVKGAFTLPDGRILSWSNDGTLHLWDAATGKCIDRLEGHVGGVEGALLLPNHRVLSWSRDQTLRVWSLTAPAVCVVVLQGHTAAVRGALLHPDGKLLSWSDDHTIRAWDTDTGTCTATLAGHAGSVRGALALPRARALTWPEGYPSDDHTLRVWDLNAGTCTATLAGLSGEVDGALLLPDGKVVSWTTWPGRGERNVCVWDLESGACVASLSRVLSRVRGAQLIDDGRVFLWGWDGVLVWDIASGVVTMPSERTVYFHLGGAVALSDGRVLTWSDDSTEPDHAIRIWNAANGEHAPALVGHSNRVIGAMQLDDGRVLSWGADNDLRVWNTETCECLTTLRGHAHPVSGALRLDDRRIVSWARDGTLRVWDTLTGDDVVSLDGHTDLVDNTLLLPDDRVLTWSGRWSTDRTLRVWSLTNGSCVATLGGHTTPVAGALLLPDGRVLSWPTGFQSKDREMRVWDTDSGACVAMLRGHSEPVLGVMLLPDRRVLSWSFDHTLRIWETTSGTCVATLSGHSDPVEGAMLLPDGRVLSWASGSRSKDFGLRIWDTKSGSCVAYLAGHAGRVGGTLLLPGGQLLTWTSGFRSNDYSLRIWDTSSGKCLATLVGHTREVDGACVLDDGRLLTWAADGTLRLWDATSGAHFGTWDLRRAPHDVPTLHEAFRNASTPAPSGERPSWRAWGGQGFIVLEPKPAEAPIYWHADGDWTVKHLMPDGTIVGTCSKEVAILHLHRGDSRANLDEAFAVSAVALPATTGT